MKQSGWTSLEQSKTLLKNGLDEKSADLYWICGRIHTDGPKYQVLVTAEACYDKESAWPAWSLGKLIELLPKTIEIKKPKNLYFLEILPANNCIAYTALNENKEYVFLKMFATGTESDATLLDNVIEMIVWLLDNGYIKKGNKL